MLVQQADSGELGIRQQAKWGMSVYYNLSKEFVEVGKKRLAGDTTHSATNDEIKTQHQESRDLKEVVAEQALALRLLKKSMLGAGGDEE